ncbi:baseplate assembly protein [Chitinimonas arctica]|uniref:Baseplate assembly protein n=1 Tax=Chitinimonas arctica TaxID=2594795 RepID=A0A516SJJ0_9NEIS|nr:baseplate J/gp47 family protein [Chitinimonas arctica]QDQ28307.1 baseplate assembly protein [Chitinimonas arctica]
MNNLIDLARLPPPAVIEELDFETIFQGKLGRFRTLYPQFSAVLETDPVIKLLELATYDELTLRARINDAAQAVLLPFARGSDLEQLAALLGVSRLLLDAGNPAAQPPVPATYEDDERLRLRAQMALEGETVAGSRDSYVFHALSADAHVADVAVDSPVPGTVRVTVLSVDGDGSPGAGLLSAVAAYLSAEDRRPLSDTVQVRAASLRPFALRATLYRRPGPDGDPAEAAARAALAGYLADCRRIGRDVPRSGLYAALHVPGIVRVDLQEPALDLLMAGNEVALCTELAIQVVNSDER